MPTTGFTAAELEAAIAALATVDDTAKAGETGITDSKDTYRRVVEIATSLLALDPWAIFYLLFLAKNRVGQDLTTATKHLQDIVTALGEVGAATTPVTGMSLLADAEAALASMDTLARSKETVPSAQLETYTQAVGAFVDKSITPNVRQATGSGSPETYKITRPPQEARTAIQNALKSLIDLHPIFVAEVVQLQQALPEFVALDLAARAARTAIRRVWITHHQLTENYAADTEYSAVGRSRSAYLTLEAGRAVITNLAVKKNPLSPKMQATATDTNRMTVYYPAMTSTPATLIGAQSGPFPVVQGVSDGLLLAADGGADQAKTLTPTTPAVIEGAVVGPFHIYDTAVAGLLSSKVQPYVIAVVTTFRVYVKGTCYSAVIGSGSLAASTIVSYINGAVDKDGNPITAIAEAYVSGTKFGIRMKSGGGRIVIGTQTTLNGALGLTDDQDTEDLTTTQGHSTPNNKIRFLVDVTKDVEATLPTGAAVSTASVAVAVGVGGDIIASDVAGKLRAASARPNAGARIVAAPTTATHKAAMEVLGIGTMESVGADTSLEQVLSSLASLTGAESAADYTQVAAGTTGRAAKTGVNYELRVPLQTAAITTADKVQITAGANAGSYGLSAVTSDATYTYLRVDRPFKAIYSVNPNQADNQSWSVVRGRLKLTSTSQGLSSSLEVKAATANAVIGLTVGKVVGSVSGLRVLDASGAYVSFKAARVAVGDVVTLGGPTYTTSHTVVRADEFQIDVSPEVPNDALGHLFSIRAGGEVAYTAYAAALAAWQSAYDLTEWSAGVDELGRVLTPILAEERPSEALLGAALGPAQSLLAQYQALSVVFAGFVVPKDATMLGLLGMLQERGLDRAHDLLLLGEIEEAFGLSWDSASYAGAMQSAVRDVVRNDVPAPVSDSSDDEYPGTDIPDVDVGLDFSDQDDETVVDVTDDYLDEEDLDLV